MKIVLVAGARPNFMKIAPIIHAILKAKESGKDISYRLVHTGQHYDEKLSKQFFDQLNIPKPHVNLEVGSGSHATQTAAIMVAFEQYLVAHPADLVLVVGDVNSTMAAAIVAKKLMIKVAHVEAGIRSFDRKMPEEINRLATDAICDLFYTTSTWAGENLIKEGISPNQIEFVGNTMIDTLRANEGRFIEPECFYKEGLVSGQYIASTLHRPSNVDDPQNLKVLLDTICKMAGAKKVVFPCHPRTKAKVDALGALPSNLVILEPMGYLQFMYLIKHAYAVVTDSGGIQEETTVLGIPCMTLRDSTERPETVSEGSNVLVGTNPLDLEPYFQTLDGGGWKQGQIPAKWDGKTSDRIIEHILSL